MGLQPVQDRVLPYCKFLPAGLALQVPNHFMLPMAPIPHQGMNPLLRYLVIFHPLFVQKYPAVEMPFRRPPRPFRSLHATGITRLALVWLPFPSVHNRQSCSLLGRITAGFWGCLAFFLLLQDVLDPLPTQPSIQFKQLN
jgi:hypothetical protein